MGGIAAVRPRSIKMGFIMALAGLALGLSAARPAAADVQSFEIDAYSENFGVSEGLAEERMETQADGTEADIVGELEDRLGADYAGVWFDNATGEFVVPMLPGTSGQVVSSELAAAELGEDEFRTRQVQSSWEELEAAQDQIDAGWAMLVESGRLGTGMMRTGLDPRANSVIVRLSTQATDAEKAEVERLVGRVGVDVELLDINPERLDVKTMACSVQYRMCDLPLRGGTYIESSLSENRKHCSTAFPARGNTNGKRYILTAGHCIAGGHQKAVLCV